MGVAAVGAALDNVQAMTNVQADQVSLQSSWTKLHTTMGRLEARMTDMDTTRVNRLGGMRVMPLKIVAGVGPGEPAHPRSTTLGRLRSGSRGAWWLMHRRQRRGQDHTPLAHRRQPGVTHAHASRAAAFYNEDFGTVAADSLAERKTKVATCQWLCGHAWPTPQAGGFVSTTDTHSLYSVTTLR